MIRTAQAYTGHCRSASTTFLRPKSITERPANNSVLKGLKRFKRLARTRLNAPDSGHSSYMAFYYRLRHLWAAGFGTRHNRRDRHHVRRIATPRMLRIGIDRGIWRRQGRRQLDVRRGQESMRFNTICMINANKLT